MIRYEDVCAVLVTRGDVDMSWVDDLPYGEKIIWDNSKQPNRKVFGRYSGAELTQRPVVYFQDDDVRFHNHEGLLDCYQPGTLVANMYDDWIGECGYPDLALVGLGSIMDRNLWKNAFYRYRGAFPGDERFTLDCDFIFGVLAHKIRRVDLGHEILDIASADNRLWRQEGQLEGKWRSIRRARSLRRVTLAVMAKNEAHHIARMLDSARGLFDNITLLDTVSTDGTPDVVLDWAEEHGIWASCNREEFTNFGEMRNLLLERARRNGDYILMMDADEELIWSDNGPDRTVFGELWADAYVFHYDGELDYAQPRLISSRFPWRFDGKVHAALEVDGEMTPTGVNVRNPLIRHHGDMRQGFSDAFKRMERDVHLCQQEIETGNDVPRHTFLLAKAYEGLHDRDAALRVYKARMEQSYGEEEDYYSAFRAGVLTAEHKQDFAGAVELLLDAYKRRPTRVEALRAMAYYATYVADRKPYPEDDMVIVHRNLYKTPQEG